MREKMAQMSEEQRAEHRKHQNELRRHRVANMSDEEREARRKYQREYQRQWTKGEKWRDYNKRKQAEYRAQDPTGAQEACRKWRAANPGQVRELHQKEQAGKVAKRVAKAGRPRPDHCEICHKPAVTAFDHCHVTGKFRGWLCYRCNLGLGLMEDSPELLLAMHAYLTKAH